jgi:hypothetical protein
MKLKAVALTGVMSLAGLGLIGAGAHAVFTTNLENSSDLGRLTASGRLSMI